MLSRGITILCTLESHSNNAQVQNLNAQYGPNLRFTHTHNKDHPRPGGIVIVTNRKKTCSDLENIVEVEPGRAITATIKWPTNSQTNFLTIYAPNHPNENANFWKQITSKIKCKLINMPDIILRDFNMVEEALDRLPPHTDPHNTTKALLELKAIAGLSDGWRRANPPPERDYTFEQPSGGSRLRIDRIYINENIMSRTLDWKIDQPQVPTDHQLVSMSVYDLNTPHIGRGRWAMPKSILDDKNFLDTVTEIGRKTLESLSLNPQEKLASFINQTRTLAKQTSKIRLGKMNSKIKKLTKAKQRVLQKINVNNRDEVEQANEIASAITRKIQDIERTQFKKNRTTAKANWRLKGKLVNKYWCTFGKEHKNRDTIMELRKNNPQPASYTTNSLEMTNEMASYHQMIQNTDLVHPTNTREAAINNALKDLPSINT